MAVRPWYKRYPGDFIGGTLQMSLEQKGAYSMVLDLIYDRGGPIPDDSQWIARVCGCSTRKWNAIRAYLIEIGKLVADSGHLMNARASSQLKTEEKEHENFVKSGRKGAESRANDENKSDEKSTEPIENNEIAENRLGEGLQHARAFQKLEAREEGSVVSNETTGAAAPSKPNPENDLLDIPEFLRRQSGPKPAGLDLGDAEAVKRACYQLANQIGRRSAPTELMKLDKTWLEIHAILALAVTKTEPGRYLAGILRKAESAPDLQTTGAAI